MDLEDFCVFCEIVAGRAPATVVRDWPNALAIVPLEPVTEGHTLVLSKDHAPDFTSGAEALLWPMMAAADLGREMGGDMNLITSRGAAATQTVFHLRLHLIPRREGDRLALPWSDSGDEPNTDEVAQVLRDHDPELMACREHGGLCCARCSRAAAHGLRSPYAHQAAALRSAGLLAPGKDNHP